MIELTDPITESTPVSYLLETYPRCFGILHAVGINLLTWPSDASTPLAALLPDQGKASLLDALNTEADKARISRPEAQALRQRLIQEGAVNLAGFADFTWQNAFIEEMEHFATSLGIRLNHQLFLKGNKKPFQNYLACCETQGDLPDILVGKGFSSLMTRRFMRRFVATGTFDAGLQPAVSPTWQQAGLVDPAGQYQVFGVEELVILHDRTKACPAPLPRRWDDLLRPEYANTVTLMGKPQRDHFGFSSLFYLVQQHGETGLRRFSRTVRERAHFSRIIKDIGKNHPQASPFNLVQRYASLFMRQGVDAQVLELEDGNPVTPFFCLVKKGSSSAVQTMARHLFSREIASLIEKGGAIAAHPDSPLAARTKLRWIGWEAIHQADLPLLKEQLSARAYDAIAQPSE